ncbi:MAG TPA: DUF6152 family protein [Bryobacteraceae bacterium]|nr:DUF6152 family protein [Bryobacteraceae bacterium]
MRTGWTMGVAVTSMILAAAPAWAHHSFAAEFDVNKVVNLMGTVTQMEWVNPHAVIHLAVANSDGTVTNWAIEGNTPNSLLRAGLTKKSLEPGTALAVQGYLAKSGDNKVSASAIMLRDGRTLSVGSRDAGAVLGWISSDEELWKRQLAAWAANQQH